MNPVVLALDGIGTGLYIVSVPAKLRPGLVLAFIAALACFAGAVLAGSMYGEVLHGSLAVMFAWLWWRNGGGRRMKKAARELGAKSKARVAALVGNLKPSPVPTPGSAR